MVSDLTRFRALETGFGLLIDEGLGLQACLCRANGFGMGLRVQELGI